MLMQNSVKAQIVRQDILLYDSSEGQVYFYLRIGKFVSGLIIQNEFSDEKRYYAGL